MSSNVNITVFNSKAAQEAAERAELAATKAENIKFLNLKSEIPAPAGLVLPSLDPIGNPVVDGMFMEVNKGNYTNVDSTALPVVKDKGRLYFNQTKWEVALEWDLPMSLADGKVLNGELKSVSGDTVFKAIHPIEKALTPTRNKVNYLDFKGGTYTVQAVTNKVIFGAGANWISINIVGLKPNTKYNLHDFDADMGASTPLIMFSDSSEVFISQILKSEFTGTFTTPANLGHTFIAIANKTGIGTGTNPQDNDFTGKVMLSEGAATLPFEPFGFNVQVPVSSSPTSGDSKPISSDGVYQEVTPIKANVKTVSKDIGDIKPSFESSLNLADYMKFVPGGWITSIVSGLTKVIYSPSNNWISIQIDGLEPGVHNVQGFHAGIGAANDLILHSDVNNVLTGKMTKSEVDSANGDFTVPANTEHTYFRIANIASPPIGLTPTENAYTNTFMVSYGAGNKSFVQYSSGLLLASKIKEDYPSMFVEMIPVTTPYAGTEISREVARVYEKIKGGVYACHSIRYQYLAYADYVGPSDFHGGKVVRYSGSMLVTYNKSNNTFSDMGQILITPNESEFVLNVSGWSGGYHGNEDYSTVHFLINNKVHNPSGDVNFTALGVTPIKSFSYITQSKIVQEGTQATLADRKKVNSFVDGGYHVKSRFKWLQARNMMMYSGICCVAKSFTEVTTDSGSIIVPSGSTLFPVDNDNFGREVFYRSPNVEIDVTSRILDPAIDANAILRVHDRVQDTKYYRQLVTYVSAIGGVLEVEQKVTIR